MSIVFSPAVAKASDKQRNYIHTLMVERIVSAEYARRCQRPSMLIDYLRDCPRDPNAQPDPEREAARDARPATVGQINYARSLMASRVPNADQPDWDTLTFGEASQIITALKDMPMPTVDPALTPGAYLHDGVVYSVRQSRESGRLHAYTLVDGSWSFVRGMSARLQPSERLSLEQAASFGAATGVCCHCGRTLTNAESVQRGIGPICAQSYA